MTAENREAQTANPFFRIITFGCKVNQCDTAALAQDLAEAGWAQASPGTTPDLILVNTCTVTGRADQQARQAVRRLAREHPGTPLWVTGCYAQRAPQEVAALPGVRAVLGNREKARLADLLAHFPPCPSYPPPPKPELRVGEMSTTEPFHFSLVRSFLGHTRAWLKIQEGCSHRCTYCIVPQVRGPRRSLDPGAVAAGLEELAALGYREVVLTGVDLGQYGQDLHPPGRLAGLVRRLRGHSRSLRVRLSSLEPQEVTVELLQELAAWREFCPHFHLPLQSGATPVLAAMGRPYAPGEFRDLVRELHRLFPEAALGLDVLVGFPGETAADFAATRSLVASLPATYLHVFPFSPRPGTPAAHLQPLPGGEVIRRARSMREMGRQKRAQFLQSQLGRVREVLVEGPAPQAGWLTGLSDNYLRVLLPGPAEWRNRLLKVRLVQATGEALRGEVMP